jgi:hypothetical protein
MPTEAKDRFFCIECSVQVVVGGEAQAQSAAVRFQGSSASARAACTSARTGPNRPKSTFVNPFERGEIGPDLFRAARLIRAITALRDQALKPHAACAVKKELRPA